MDTPKQASPQEKIAAALGSIIFFIPLLMDVKTEYVISYMKQGFMINLVQVSLSLITLILWFLGPLTSLLSFGLFFFSLFIAFQAYGGRSYSFPLFVENADKIIDRIGIRGLFTPNK